MDNKKLIFGLFLIIIPLILFVLWYRNYVYNYCKNDMKCLKEKLIFNLDNLNNKLKNYGNKKIVEENDNKINEQNKENLVVNEEENIEGFFSGFGNWFSGSSPSSLPVSPGSLQNEDLSLLEKKISDKMTKSNKFPPSELNGNSDDFEDADNSEILNNSGTIGANSIKPMGTIGSNSVKPMGPIGSNSIKPMGPIGSNSIKPIGPIGSNSIKSKELLKEVDSEDLKEIINIKNPDIKSILGKCQFFNDKCPDKYYELGNFSIQGVGNGNILTCGNVQNTKPARAVAQIKNNAIYEIHITDQGHGFNPSSPPKVSIEGGKGHGATAEAVVDDDGFLKLIKIINPGYNYSETPNVMIDAPFMNSSCHLCCNDE
jgi:hypothetical protein